MVILGEQTGYTPGYTGYTGFTGYTPGSETGFFPMRGLEQQSLW